MQFGFHKIKRSAILSLDKIYRYSLSRIWNDDLPIIIFVGINPSTANSEKDDRTTKRLIYFTKYWEYGGFIIINLFAFRSKNPKDLLTAKDPIGPENKFWQNKIIEFNNNSKIVVMWGCNGKLNDEDKKFLKRFDDVYCFGKTKDGYPKHSLYLKKDTKLEKYESYI